MASSSSFASDSQYCPQWKYHVFLSFRGADTRNIFIGHLYKGLTDMGIETFQDDKSLREGDSIPKELLEAIEESQVALIIFSKNYATSGWCLSELVKIMDCKEKNGKTVIPIFYHVDPSNVRYQSSESFAKAFADHESRFKDDVEGMQKVQGWRTALTTAANLKGYVIRDGVESDHIQHIVKEVSSEFFTLCKASVSFLPNVVGINTHLEKVNSLLEMEVNDVRIVGIWGMPGVGKTTIARAIFDTLSRQFDGACFLEGIKENKDGMHSLQNILLCELLKEDKKHVNNKEDGKRTIAHKLRFKKFLVVLDDIDHRDHLDYIAEDLNWFGKGSRIIVTTRDKHLIGKNDAIHEVTPLCRQNAIELFYQYAFKGEVPGDECFEQLSLEVINQAEGLPLALKVWGSFLYKRDITEWRSAVKQLKTCSGSEIFKRLKISYDGLETILQDIFLDIACFFRGKEKDNVMRILESCYSGADIGLSVLIDKSLVFISKSKYDIIQMHDLIQDMGKYIVKMQKHPWERSRLWDVEDIEEVMVNNTGTNMAVEAIWAPYYKELWFSKEAVKNMQRLRILYIHGYDLEENDGSIEYLPNNLRCLVWIRYPWNLLPQNLNSTRLVHIELRESSLHHLWNETKQQLPSLRKLILSGSKSLKRTPDFTRMPNLEYLDLSFCMSLEEVHHSLGCSSKLIELNLHWCENLKTFPYVNLESLESLNLLCCSSLKKLPEFLGIMKQKSAIKISDCYIHLRPHHTTVHWSGMHFLVALPSFICKLKCLVELDVSSCFKLESLPEEIADLESLVVLDACNTLISRPPSSIVRLNRLKILTFGKTKLEDGAHFMFPEVNEGLRSLKELDLSYCNLIDGGLPEDIGFLSSLKTLDLSGNNFEHLPRSIAQHGALQSLDLSCCNKLKEFPSFTGMTNLHILDLSYCNLIDGGLLEDIGCLSSLKVLNLIGNNFEHLPLSIAQHDAFQSLASFCTGSNQLDGLSDCKRIKELIQKLSSLQHDISASDSLSLRVFKFPFWQILCSPWHIPNWFHHWRTGRSVSVNLPEHWYVSDKFLGFAVCCFGKKLMDITAHLIPLCHDGMLSMTQEFALSNHSEYHGEDDSAHFLLVPLAGLWDASKANGKTPNDYGLLWLYFSGKVRESGVRLLYNDELSIGIRRNLYEEGSCSSSKKQRSQFP